jgi:pyroglutamyl-peptidase
MKRKKILVTAFEPFNGQIINPSLEATRMLESMCFPYNCIKTLELPVHRFGAVKSTLNCIRDFQPHIVLMLGEAGGRGDITPELQAFNLDDFPIPDHGGHQPKQELIVEGGPEKYF